MSSVAAHCSIQILWNSVEGLLMSDPFLQNAAHGGTADGQPTGDLGLADASTIQFPDLAGMECCCYRPAQALAILAGLCQASADSFTEYLPFELSKNGQQASHRSTGGRRQ